MNSFKTRVHAAVAAQQTPVDWVVVDASSINVIDVTALRKLDELRSELAAKGVSVYFARVKRHLERFFNTEFAKERRMAAKQYRFQTLKPAIRAYLKHQKAKGMAEIDNVDSEEDVAEWCETVQPPRMETPYAVANIPDPKRIDELTKG